MSTARGVLFAWLLALAVPVSAQAPARIAWIWPGSVSGELPRSSAFREGMRENGLTEGRDYVLDERYANGNYERFPAITDELLALKPAILMVNTIASVHAAQQATKSVPIVFVATNDPLGSGLIASYARPGGNTTGLSTQNEDVVTKHLQLLREIIPRASRIAVLVNPGNPSGPKLFEYLRASARGFGIDAFAVNVASPQGLDAALSTVAQRRPDALIGVPDAMLFSERERVIAFALRNRIPHFSTAREMGVAGSLVTYGHATRDTFRHAAVFVKKILAGATPGDLPVEQPTKFELVINLKTARALGLIIPQSLLLRADEVIRMTPETRYAKSGDVNIAYQVVGDGPRDLILVPGWLSNIEVFWEEPAVARFLRRLASFSRLILFDKRGTGLSDRMGDLPSLETRMDDVRAVMDAVGSERAGLCGYSEGGVMCALFAATYPARTAGLVMIGSYSRLKPAPDYPWGRSEETLQQILASIQHDWGGPVGLDFRAPSLAQDERFRQWYARYQRMGASPGAAAALARMNYEIDIRSVLPVIRVPTLLLHATRDLAINVGASRYMAERIAGAKLVELPGPDHLPWGSDADAILDEIEEFLTGERHSAEPDRILATILFTDIVGSTDRAAALGDHRWRDLLESFYVQARRELRQHRGVEIATAGDGVMATFDGPARGIRCARNIADSVHALGIDVRTGLHTGECELMGDNIGGIAVHTAARIAALAQPAEVLVSHTVKDLVAGSGIRFDVRGTHTLKGIPGEWALFAANRQGPT